MVGGFLCKTLRVQKMTGAGRRPDVFSSGRNLVCPKVNHDDKGVVRGFTDLLVPVHGVDASFAGIE